MSLKSKNKIGYRCNNIKSEAYIIPPTPALKLTRIIQVFMESYILH